MEYPIQQLADALRAARKRTGDTQVIAAGRVGVSTLTYQNLEQGKPGVAISTWLRAIEIYGNPENLEFLFSSSLFDE